MAKRSSLKRRLAEEKKANKPSSLFGQVQPTSETNGKDTRRSTVEFVAKKLPTPEFKVIELGEGKIGIECPYKTCCGKSVVNKKRWLTIDLDFLSRACTYCGKFIFIPKDTLPKGDPRR